jgi:hypothetical protein
MGHLKSWKEKEEDRTYMHVPEFGYVNSVNYYHIKYKSVLEARRLGLHCAKSFWFDQGRGRTCSCSNPPRRKSITGIWQ